MHGHDRAMLFELKDFLQSWLGLRNASQLAAIAFKSDPASNAKLIRLSTARSLHALGIPMAHVLCAT